MNKNHIREIKRHQHNKILVKTGIFLKNIFNNDTIFPFQSFKSYKSVPIKSA